MITEKSITVKTRKQQLLGKLILFGKQRIRIISFTGFTRSVKRQHCIHEAKILNFKTK